MQLPASAANRRVRTPVHVRVHLSTCGRLTRIPRPVGASDRMRAPPRPMPIIDLPTLRVHYEQAGSGREVLVFVHGNFASSRWWQPVLESLPAEWRAYAPDLRGCGRTESTSNGAAAEYAIPRLADDLAGFVDRLELPAFHL